VRFPPQANPTNAWLGWGDFSTGFDSWIGVGQILSTPALFEGILSREVYFPKSSPEDKSTYFDLNAPYKTYVAGTKATISTPLEHMSLFTREGAVIPIGKAQATVTETSGSARTTTEGRRPGFGRRCSRAGWLARGTGLPW